MPLTTERPGLFRGIRNNRAAWYVISPDAEGDVVGEWRANYAPTNRPRWQRVTRGSLGWLTFVAVGVLAIAFLTKLPAGEWIWTALMILLGFFAVLVATAAGVWVGSAVFPDRPARSSRFRGAVEVDPAIATWARDDVAATDLWDLSLAVSRVRQVSSWFWSHDPDSVPPGPPSQEVVEYRALAAMNEQWEEEAAHLITLADRLRFTVPDDVWDREPRDDD